MNSAMIKNEATEQEGPLSDDQEPNGSSIGVSGVSCRPF